MNALGAWFRVGLPPATGGSALGVIELAAADGDAMDHALMAIGAPGVGVGEAKLRRIAGIDQGVVARVSKVAAVLMPHGSELVMRGIADELERLGIERRESQEQYPEAADRYEALMLETLARAASPMAIDVLLRQPEAWRRAPAGRDAESRRRSATLRRLIEPPLVAAIGYANVGKSTLLNALARRAVAVVSPEAGTTRDHVGATLDLGGLVVHWVDTPGLRPEGAGAIEAEAFAIARKRVADADLVVLCGDAEHGFASPSAWGVASVPVIRCGTKCDREIVPGSDVATAAERGDGIQRLAEAVREALVPQELISDPSAWHFHPLLEEIGVAEAPPGRYC